MLLFYFTIVVCLGYAFFNGFSDAANAISTIVATRVLKPVQAVALSALGNLLGVALGTAVAYTIGKGIIASDLVDAKLILAAIIGGLIFDIATWLLGLPVSETHVLIGGLMGAGTAAASFSAVNFNGVVNKVMIPMILSPTIAFLFSIIFTLAVIRLFFTHKAARINRYFRKLQIGSSLFFSITHGANDGQMVMGIVTAVMVQQGVLTAFVVPLWVKISIPLMIAIGTLFGGWRIVKTMAKKITKLKPYQGFCAETAGALVLGVASLSGFPISTTHAISGSIMGVGASRHLSRINWGVARSIIIAWVLTMPISAISAYIIYKLLFFL
jgi:PiT family inorganic phosphate transporter